MSVVHRITRLAGLLFRRRDLIQRDADDELASVFEGRIERGIASGLSPDEARAAALRQLGVPIDEATAQLRQSAARRERVLARHEWLTDLGADIRYALRGFRREPLFFGFAALTLALGVGANSAMFGIVDRLLVRGPAYVRDSHRVGRIYWTMRTPNGTEITQAAFDNQVFANLVADSHDFVGFARYTHAFASRFGDGDGSRRVSVAAATSNFMSVLGAPPVLGRFFTTDEQSNDLHVAVIGYDLWQSELGDDRDVIGRQITLSDRKYTVVGVTPRGFTGANLDHVDVWQPLNAPTNVAARHWTDGHSAGPWTIARVEDGITFEDASRDATLTHRRTYDGDQAEYAEGSVSVAPLRYGPAGTELRETSISVWVAGVSLVVLLIACANIANLLLARASRRRREIAVRLALGGSRWRIARLVLVSTLVLSIVGGLGAIAVAGVLSGVVRHALLPDVDWTSGAIDSHVLGFSLAIIAATALLSGFLPAWRAGSTNASAVLKSGDHHGDHSRSVLRGTLMWAQSTLAMLLLIGAGLFVRSLSRVRALDLGLQPDRVVVLSPRWQPRSRKGDAAAENARRANAIRSGIARLKALPGVERVAAAGGEPFGASVGTEVFVPGWDSLPHLPGDDFAYPSFNAVTADYFATLGTRLLQGRAFTDADREGTEPVVIAGAAMAAALWPNESPLNKCVRVGGRIKPCSRVVGVVQDARKSRINEPPSMQYFMPLGQGTGAQVDPDILVRPRGDAAAAIPALRAAVREIDPMIRFVDATVLQDRVDPQFRTWRVGAMMFSLFAGLAIVVSAVGMFGVVAYLVEQRRYEIGVRIALGARQVDVVGLMARGAIIVTAAGVVTGSGLALAAGRFVSPLLFETTASDPLTITFVAILLLSVATMAGGLPALRAQRVDPMAALRAD